MQQKQAFYRTVALIRGVEKPSLTTPQAKRLDSLGLDYEEVCRLQHDCVDKEEFLEGLKGRGVKSKPVRYKLLKAALVVTCSRQVLQLCIFPEFSRFCINGCSSEVLVSSERLGKGSGLKCFGSVLYYNMIFCYNKSGSAFTI